MTLERRIFATLAALVLIATHVAGVGHYVLVAHYFCAEHGTLHEGSPERRVDSVPSDSRETAAVDLRDEHAHDECSYFSRGGDSASVSSTLTVVLLANETPTTSALRDADARIALGILGFAPKQSPPLAS